MSYRHRLLGAAVALLLTAPLLAACSERELPVAQPVGDPAQGREAISRYGCGSCHRIPGIAGADGRVGPPLQKIARRGYLGGVLANTPDNMARWIRVPEEVDPRTAMPNMGVTERDAQNITAYLYTLR